MPHRRTISIDDNLHSLIQRTRGEFLSNLIDLDYTRAVNMLLALGLETINTRPWSTRAAELIIAHGMNDRLKYESIIDEFQDEFVRKLPQMINDLPDLVEKIKKINPS